VGASRRRTSGPGWVLVALSSALVLAGCGASHPRTSTARTPTAQTTASSPRTGAATTASPRVLPRPRPAQLIAILPTAHRQGLFGWTAAVAVRGQTAVWVSRVKAYGEAGFTITLLRFDQRLVTLALHAGGSEPGGSGWRYGAAISDGERRVVVAAFNSAFREGYGAGGFEEDGRVGWPLRRGAASVVVYRDGTADIGRWHEGFPEPGRAIAAVRQNLGLLIDAGRVPSSVDTCIKRCWGDPLHEQPIVARSALGVTPDGELVLAAGHNLSVRALAEALAGKGVVRAMELDINPRWVAAYVYAHPRHGTVPTAVPLVPGQTGIPGQFLQPYFRDFFTVVARTSA
jgi:hypothetical protein